MKNRQPPHALDLAVHSLPDAVAHPSSVLSGRLKLLAIVLLCSLPVLLAYLAFYVVRPQGSAMLGELISPVRLLPVATATDMAGAPVPLAALKKQWLLVKVDGGACSASCQRQLLLLRQFRLMLGKDMNRVDWVWLVNDGAPIAPALALNLKKDNATVLRLSPQVVSDWLPAGTERAGTDSIFVVDPMGNTMLRLPANLDSTLAAKAKRDMAHLLQASASWDSPGR